MKNVEQIENCNRRSFAFAFKSLLQHKNDLCFAKNFGKEISKHHKKEK